MSIKIKFAEDAPAKQAAKIYTGDMAEWPDGVYRRMTFVASDVYVLVRRGKSVDPEILTQYDGALGKNRTVFQWVRISDDPTISSITFAGTANYPDGKPEGWAV
jgi:hypothetical protein